MHIGFISTHIDSGKGGIARYSYELIKNLNIIDKGNEYYLIHNKINNYVQLSNKNILLRSPFPDTIWRFSVAPIMLKYLNHLDLVHDPYPIGPLSFNMPFKKIVTVCDLAHIFFPKTATFRLKLSHRLFLSKTLSNADKIIAISQSTRNDLKNYLKIPEEKIQVIYLGVDERFRQLSDQEIDDIKIKYSIQYPFILYVGGLEPRKNILTLIKSFYKIKKRGIKHKMVLTGKRSWNYRKIFDCIHQLNLQKEIVYLEYVPDVDLPSLYNAADLFVYPSIYEGFGFPPLEAMACGTPVITSNTSSLPEVVGNAGIMANPRDVNDIANALNEVLSNEDLKYGMVKKGLEQAKKFEWITCAKETLKNYEKVINS